MKILCIKFEWFIWNAAKRLPWIEHIVVCALFFPTDTASFYILYCMHQNFNNGTKLYIYKTIIVYFYLCYLQLKYFRSQLLDFFATLCRIDRIGSSRLIYVCILFCPSRMGHVYWGEIEEKIVEKLVILRLLCYVHVHVIKAIFINGWRTSSSTEDKIISYF